ncbi:MAG: DUF192 domain-containing protein [Candidatus Staskawiczbacteria bacterium]|nr:DUF192 domain-containing protein [Candidatus Staskawiczbacteria bacterium]
MKMSLEIILLIIAVIILIYIFYCFAGTLLAPVIKQDSLSSVCYGKKCFQIELAITKAQRQKGLMYRNELNKDKGMLFVFNKEGIYPFWMKNTLIPLDMIWIDSSNKVVFVSQNVQPCKNLICPSVMPIGPAKYVLELNAGICDEIGLKAGVVLDMFFNGIMQ